MANAGDEFAAGLTDAVIELNQLSEDARRKVVRLLHLLHNELATAIQEADLGAGSTASRRRRAEKLIRDIRLILDRRYEQAEGALGRTLRPVLDRTQHTLRERSGIDLCVAVPHQHDLELRSRYPATLDGQPRSFEQCVGAADAVERSGVQHAETVGSGPVATVELLWVVTVG